MIEEGRLRFVELLEFEELAAGRNSAPCFLSMQSNAFYAGAEQRDGDDRETGIEKDDSCGCHKGPPQPLR